MNPHPRLTIHAQAGSRSELIGGLNAALAPFLVSRAIVWLGTELGARFIPWTSPALTFGFRPSSAIEPFFRWDADYYAAIVRYAYAAAPAGAAPPVLRAAFFPLYPLLVRLAGGSDWAMLLIPNLAFLAALGLLYVIASRRLDPERARLTLWLVALGPSAMFFSYPYTESLFLLLSVGSFVLMEAGQWLLAGVVGLGAAVTRVPGVLVGLALGGQAALGNRRWTLAVASVLPVMGLVLVSILDRAVMGDPLGFLHAQALWIGAPRNPLYLIGSFPKAVLEGDPFRPEAMGIPILLAFAIAAVWVVFRMPPAYSAFAVAQVLLAARQGLYLHYFISVPRYLAVVFPCYFAFATLIAPRRNLQLGWLLVSASVMLSYAALYGAWRFIG